MNVTRCGLPGGGIHWSGPCVYRWRWRRVKIKVRMMDFCGAQNKSRGKSNRSCFGFVADTRVLAATTTIHCCASFICYGNLSLLTVSMYVVMLSTINRTRY